MDNPQSEMKRVLTDPSRLEEVALSTFRALDIDGSGDLDFYEVCKLMTWLAKTFNMSEPSEPQISEVFERLDENNDGRITFVEYQSVISSLLKQWLADTQG
jgi:Ca2+-binding EF-hand superfamily protein